MSQSPTERALLQQALLRHRRANYGTTTGLDLFKPLSEGSSKLLGRGGYGSVISVVGRLDNKKYALKRVRLKENSSKRGMRKLREVSILSQLNHPNVVRYHNAWIQRDRLSRKHSSSSWEVEELDQSLEGMFGEATEDSDCSEEIATNGSSGESQSVNHSREGIPLHLIQGEETLECFICNAVYDDWQVTLEEWHSIGVDLQPHNLCIPCFLKNYRGKAKASVFQKPKLPLHLYIQMEFCEETLNQRLAILREKYGDRSSELRLMLLDLGKQIANGLTYLHSVKVIHRDLKPDNIFVVGGRTIKIGDLGGAVGGEAISDYVTYPGSNEKSMAGTYLYLSPEAKDHDRFHFASDIFSFGVVLFEIFCGADFSTGMERSIVLEGLRNPLTNEAMRQSVSTNPRGQTKAKSELPSVWKTLLHKDADVSSLIMDALHYEPELRPSAQTILKRLERLRSVSPALQQENFECRSCKDLQDMMQALQLEAEKKDALHKNEIQVLKQEIDSLKAMLADG